jgi:DNA-binding HxlR family transcriptional regulator
MLGDWQTPRQVARLLAGKWTLAVLAALSDGPLRFTELERALGGNLRHNSLTETLTCLCDAGLVERTRLADPPRAVRYALTPPAPELLQAAQHLAEWHTRHRDRITLHPHTDPDHPPDP